MEKVMKPWIARIKKCDWFANVGAGELEGVGRVGSWKDVKQHLKGDGWDAMCVAASEEYHKSMAQFHGRGWDKWSDGFDDRFDEVDELLEEVMLPAIKRKKAPDGILDLFRGNVMCLASWLHFFGADHQSIDRQIVESYLAGHCACGYERKYPKGRLIVY